MLKDISTNGQVRTRLDFSNLYPRSTDGAIQKAGSSSSPVTASAASTNFFQYYTKSTATSGDNRGIYNRLYLAGAGGGGESLRSFTTVSDVAAGTAHGAHLSLSFGTSGSITGLGVVNRNTLHIPAAMSGGTYAISQLEAWADAAASDLAGATVKTIFRVGIGGDATGLALLDTALNFIDFFGITAGSGKIINTDITALTGKASLAVTLDGTLYGYIPIVSGS